jgi:hypothetical protein
MNQMNFMPAVQRFNSQIDAIFDGEEFQSSGEDVWKQLSPWLDLEPTKVRLLDIAKWWEPQADEQFLEAVTKAEALLLADLHTLEAPASNDNQLKLAMAGSFTPSAKLIDAWKDNASRFVDGQAVARVKSIDASAEFSRMFKRLVGAFAQEKRYAGERVLNVADQSGEFDTLFQLDVSERFLLVPQKSAAFFALLYRDIVDCGSGKIYSGGWGSFIRKPDRRLVIELTPPKRIKREGFVKAQETRK